jgi:hypothetical protein
VFIGEPPYHLVARDDLATCHGSPRREAPRR